MSAVLRVALALGVVLALAGCATTEHGTPRAPARAAAAPAWISLERTASGSGAVLSPVYVVTLFEDGRVIFEGHSLVKSKGTFSATLEPKEVDSLFRQMESIRLWELERRYDVERMNRGGDSVIVNTASTEVSWDILRAFNRGRSIRIDGLFYAPRELLDFKEQLEAKIGLKRWVGEPEEWQR